MKQCTFLLCVILASTYLYGQEFPKGTWSGITDSKGNSIDSRNSANGPHQVTTFDFQEGVKYSFSFEEYDSSGRKTMTVKEYGVYSVTPSQFILTPATSTTSVYDYTAQSTKPIGNSVKQNSLSSASYRWIYQKEKDEKLSIEAINPGFREGFISGGTKKASAKPKPKVLSSVKEQVSEL